MNRLSKLSFFSTNKLIQNAYYLVSDGIFNTFLGFLFWLLAARLYEPSDIGTSSVAISTVTLLVSLSSYGLSSSLIRFFPNNPERKNIFVNFIITLTIIILSLVLAVFYIILPFWSESLKIFITGNLVSFIIFTFFYSFTIIYDSIFIAQGKPKFLVIKNFLANVVKILFLIVLTFCSFENSTKIYYSWGWATFFSFIIEIVFVRKIIDAYHPKVIYSKKIGKEIFSYSVKTHISDVVSGLPIMILPIMILELLDAKKAAYFSIIWMITSSLMIVSKSATISLFSEGSNNISELVEMVRQTVKFILSHIILLVSIGIIFGKYILLIFGKEYSANGYPLLFVMLLTLIPFGLNTTFFTILRIEKKISELLIYSLSMSGSIILLNYIFILKYGFIGIGIGWIIPQVVCTCIITWKLKRYMRRDDSCEFIA